MISLKLPQRNGPHLAWRGEPPGFSRVAARALDLRRGPQDTLWWPQERPVPMRAARGPLGIPLPSMLGPKNLCGLSAGTRGFLSSADMDLEGTSGFSPGESVLVSSGGMHVRFPPEM